MRKLTQVRRMGSLWPVWSMVLCLGWNQNPDRDNRPSPGSMLNTALPGSPGIAIYQDY
jgi:hypothetical protein